MSEKERLQIENELLMTCSKAQAINKYIDKLEESSKLSELWCKSQQENKQLKEKLSKIETLIINHNCDTGDIYYKYNSKFLKSELKQRILEILYKEGSDNK